MREKRRELSKGARFEIFKRDRFTCQYCGAKAPDIVLHIDHVEPVSAGGSNDLLNLITACQNCNAGKSNKPLAGTQTLDRKRAQLERLQDRRESIRMLYQWHQELAHLAKEELALVEETFTKRTRLPVGRDGRLHVKKWIKAYGFERVLQAMRESLDRYYQPSKNRAENAKSGNEAFNRVIRLIRWQELARRDPDRAHFLKVKGILRNRFSYVRWIQLEQAIKTWRTWNFTADELAAIANRSASWTNFCEILALKCHDLTKAEKTPPR